MKNLRRDTTSLAAATIAAIGLVAILGVTQTSAQVRLQTVPDCKAEMAELEPKVGSMKDGQQKSEAMKELSSAKAMMAKNDEQACLNHLRNIRRMSTNRPSDD